MDYFTGYFFAHRPYVYCFFEFKLRYFKNLKMFSVRVKKLSEPIVLWKKATGFSSFYKHFLSYAGWFSGKKRKIVLKIDEVETKCTRQIVIIICVTYEQKNF